MRFVIPLLLLLVLSVTAFAAQDNATITFSVSQDADGDGVSEPGDTLVGTNDTINETGFSNPIVRVNGSDSSGTFSGIRNITIYDDTQLHMSFPFDFGSGILYLANITIIKSQYQIRIYTDQIQSGYKKIVYLEDANYIGLCARDTSSLDALSDDCDLSEEINFDSCIGTTVTIGNITCDNSGIGVSFSNMTHSGARGYVAESSSTGSSRRKSFCDEVWYCSQWSGCSDGNRDRSCKQIEVCNVVSVPFISHNEPINSQSCVEDKTCSDGLRNNGETDTDCGGNCAGCDLGYLCKEDSDCNGGICTDNFCSPAHQCVVDSDCASSDACIDNVCTEVFQVDLYSPSRLNLSSLMLFIFSILLMFFVIIALISGHKRDKFI